MFGGAKVLFGSLRFLGQNSPCETCQLRSSGRANASNQYSTCKERINIYVHDSSICLMFCRVGCLIKLDIYATSKPQGRPTTPFTAPKVAFPFTTSSKSISKYLRTNALSKASPTTGRDSGEKLGCPNVSRWMESLKVECGMLVLLGAFRVSFPWTSGWVKAEFEQILRPKIPPRFLAPPCFFPPRNHELPWFDQGMFTP